MRNDLDSVEPAALERRHVVGGGLRPNDSALDGELDSLEAGSCQEAAQLAPHTNIPSVPHGFLDRLATLDQGIMRVHDPTAPVRITDPDHRPGPRHPLSLTHDSARVFDVLEDRVEVESIERFVAEGQDHGVAADDGDVLKRKWVQVHADDAPGKPRADRPRTASEIEHSHVCSQVWQKERRPPVSGATAMSRAMSAYEEVVIVVPSARQVHIIVRRIDSRRASSEGRTEVPVADLDRAALSLGCHTGGRSDHPLASVGSRRCASRCTPRLTTSRRSALGSAMGAEQRFLVVDQGFQPTIDERRQIDEIGI